MRNPNRGVVLRMDDAAAIARWMEYLMFDRKFYNPIVAAEAKIAAEAGMVRLLEKLAAIYVAHDAAAEDGQ